jgi:hypothetical protein
MFTKIRIFRFKALYLLFILLFSGCATVPKISSLKHDKSFTHEKFVAGMVGIGGVVSLANDLDQLLSRKYAGIVKDSFLSARKEFVVVPVEAVVQRIDQGHYRRLLQDYKCAGELNADSLKGLKSFLAAFRYLLLVRITGNEIIKSTEKSPRPEMPPKWDLEGNPVIKEIAVELITTRRIAVSLDIYDLKKEILVWHGTIHETKSKKRTAYIEKKDEGIGRSFALIPVRAFLEVALQPSAPPADKLLHKIFKSFAQYLP